MSKREFIGLQNIVNFDRIKQIITSLQLRKKEYLAARRVFPRPDLRAFCEPRERPFVGSLVKVLKLKTEKARDRAP